MSEKPANPQWYTIKEAAAYLDVGEPTMYRWMRDGRITFRKVGDSTRFLQGDLDAVVRVHPSTKNIEAVHDFCPVCHHGEMVQGHVQSTGLCYFRPIKTSFWSFLTGNIGTEARMCSRCGAVIWYGDTEKLASLRTNDESEVEGLPEPEEENAGA